MNESMNIEKVEYSTACSTDANRRIYEEMATKRLKTLRPIKYELPITLVSQIDMKNLIHALKLGKTRYQSQLTR